MLKIVVRAIDSYADAFGQNPREIIVSRYGNGVTLCPNQEAVVISSNVWDEIAPDYLPLALVFGTLKYTIDGIPVTGV